jgi:hypothetical protein
MVGKMTCQGLNRETASHPFSKVYTRYQLDNMPLHIRHLFALQTQSLSQTIFESGA